MKSSDQIPASTRSIIQIWTIHNSTRLLSVSPSSICENSSDMSPIPILLVAFRPLPQAIYYYCFINFLFNYVGSILIHFLLLVQNIFIQFSQACHTILQHIISILNLPYMQLGHDLSFLAIYLFIYSNVICSYKFFTDVANCLISFYSKSEQHILSYSVVYVNIIWDIVSVSQKS